MANVIVINPFEVPKGKQGRTGFGNVGYEPDKVINPAVQNDSCGKR